MDDSSESAQHSIDFQDEIELGLHELLVWNSGVLIPLVRSFIDQKVSNSVPKKSDC